jgi:YNFM family putative membrane transporter
MGGMPGFMLGAAAMFAAMYSTQTILPVLERDFDISPARAGLSISVVLGTVAVAGWAWGPFSDRYGRRRSLMLASGLLVLPTIGVAVAPSFEVLLFCRALQGLCMPGLITVGVPYVAEVFAPAIGGRAMGYYVAALVAGGLVGRVGVGLATAAAGWRWALGGIAVLPLLATLVMRRMLPEAPAPERTARGRAALTAQLHNRPLLVPAACGAALFFTFVGVASFVTFRLERAPFNYGTGTISLVFVLWALGAAGPVAGRLADRLGWRRVLVLSLATALSGVLLSLPAFAPTVVIGMGLVILGMFSGITAAQLGVSEVAPTDRGAASAVYFTGYYVAGAAAGFVPGLAWEAWRWPGVAGLATAVLVAGLVMAIFGPRSGAQATPR